MPATAHPKPACHGWMRCGSGTQVAACLHAPKKVLVLNDQDIATSTYTSHTNFTGTGPSPLGAHTARTASWTLSKA